MAIAFSSPQNPLSIREIFVSAIRSLAFAWAASAVVVSIVTYWFAPDLLGWSLLIAAASGLISLAALIPGVMMESDAEIRNQPEPTVRRHDQSSALVTAIFAAMSIRVVGTVALFLLCRYQMSLPLQMIALFVCGWYVLLTSLEVSLLAQNAKALR